MYEYACSKCGKIFEVLQKFSDAPLETHPDCGGPVEKQLSAPAFQFKGTAWYVTDYAKSGAKAESQKAEASEKAGGKSGSSGESKAGDSKSSPRTSCRESRWLTGRTSRSVSPTGAMRPHL